MIYEIEGLVPNQTNVNGVTFTGSSGVTISPSTITSDTLVYVTVSTDPNPIFNFRGEESDYILRSEETAFTLRSEQGETYLPFLNMSWTDTFGETFLQPIFIKL
ncbi:hypothetical protein UFOVP523_12 [uncultured Caudovirales phage]|uniref:Uncharacterized protein n=1 Tax=uncultured Caudovirales phage TaxID=2100421 RepID=A0A6J5MRY2_9CAUD|nr:hypothetical protein UFOVP523_12 [uncultured Caudovirales phage]